MPSDPRWHNMNVVAVLIAVFTNPIVHLLGEPMQRAISMAMHQKEFEDYVIQLKDEQQALIDEV